MPPPARVLPTFACLFCAGLAAISQAQTTRPSVSVDLALVADAPKPTLAFRVKNTGNAEVVRGELGANPNAIWILCPDGTVDGLSGIIDVFPPPGQQWRPAVISPGAEVTWEMPVESLLQSIDRPGVFRVYWDLGGTRSSEVHLLRRSNRTWGGEPTTRPAPAVRTSATPHAALREFVKAVNEDGYQHLYRVTRLCLKTVV